MHIPTLKCRVSNGTLIDIEDNEAMGWYLFNSFFSYNSTHTKDSSNFVYSKPAFTFHLVMDKQIYKAIKKLQGFNASGDNGISNIVYKNCASILVSFLGPLFCATFTLSIYP